MKKDWTIDIENHNEKGEVHGYQQWISFNDSNKLWFRGNFKNDNEIGYTEGNLKVNLGIGSEGTKVRFYIR